VADAKIAGQDVPVPARRKYVAPEYPAEAAAQGIRGIVIVEAVIGEDGRVEDVKVIRSVPGLDEAATRAVRLWEYEPTKLAGKPVRVRLSQPITFALRLPNLERAPGVPELKSGGNPPVPPSLATAETASVAVALGSQGEVREVEALGGNSVVSDALIRAVKSWRFVVSEGSVPPSFIVKADWAPGPPPVLTLKAMDLRSATLAKSEPPAGAPPPVPPAATSVPPAANPVPEAVRSGSGAAGPVPPTAGSTPTAAILVPPTAKDVSPATAPTAPSPASPAVETDVIPARQDPPAKEEGASGVADVLLGENIPELTRGRRPTWPPLARLGNITGEVVVRFSVDLAGKVTVHSADGPDGLKGSAEQAAATWVFRRTAIDRLNLIATFKFGADRSVAKVERAPKEPS
jgi:TonB family protein